MEVTQVLELFGSAKKMTVSIGRTYRSYQRWQENGIPLIVARALEGALRQRAKKCLDVADAIGTSILKAEASRRKVIKEF